jgi:hypothetical protein
VETLAKLPACDYQAAAALSAADFQTARDFLDRILLYLTFGRNHPVETAISLAPRPRGHRRKLLHRANPVERAARLAAFAVWFNHFGPDGEAAIQKIRMALSRSSLIQLGAIEETSYSVAVYLVGRSIGLWMWLTHADLLKAIQDAAGEVPEYCHIMMGLIFTAEAIQIDDDPATMVIANGCSATVATAENSLPADPFWSPESYARMAKSKVILDWVGGLRKRASLEATPGYSEREQTQELHLEIIRTQLRNGVSCLDNQDRIRLELDLEFSAAISKAIGWTTSDAAREQSGVDGEPLPTDPPTGLPDWITALFRSKQFSLLKALWGKPEVEESALLAALKYEGSRNPADTLRRRVAHTNKSLCERSDKIGEAWTIRERTRDGIKSYFLDRQK